MWRRNEQRFRWSRGIFRSTQVVRAQPIRASSATWSATTGSMMTATGAPIGRPMQHATMRLTIRRATAPPPRCRARLPNESWSKRHAPEVRLHPKEKYFPMDIRTFIRRSSLGWAHDKGCPDDEIADRGGIDLKNSAPGAPTGISSNGSLAVTSEKLIPRTTTPAWGRRQGQGAGDEGGLLLGSRGQRSGMACAPFPQGKARPSITRINRPARGILATSSTGSCTATTARLFET